MLPRIRDLILEKTRDKILRRVYKLAKLAFKFLYRIYYLNIEFNSIELRLDNIRRIPKLKLKV